MAEKTKQEDIAEMELDLGFEDHGIILHETVGKKAGKILEIKKLALKNWIIIKKRANALKTKRLKAKVKTLKSNAVASPEIFATPEKFTVATFQNNVTSGGMDLHKPNCGQPISTVHRQYGADTFPQSSYQQFVQIYPTLYNRGVSTVRPRLTMPLVRTNVSQDNYGPVNRPLIFDHNSGLLVYGNNIGKQGVRLIRPSVQSQPVHPPMNVYLQQRVPISVNANPSVFPQTFQYTSKTNVPLMRPTVYSPYTPVPTAPRIIGTPALRVTQKAPVPSSTRFQTTNIATNSTTNLMPPPATTIVLQTKRTSMPASTINSQQPCVTQTPTISSNSPPSSSLQKGVQIPQQQRFPLQPQQQKPVSRMPMLPQVPLLYPKPVVQQNVPVPSKIPSHQLRYSRNLHKKKYPPPTTTVAIPGPVRPLSLSAAAAAVPANSATSSTEAKDPTVENQSKENDNKKTYPSLVVNVKPVLMERARPTSLAKARAELDEKVKSLMLFNSQKFTEWLMQRRLLRIDYKCDVHFNEDGSPCSYKLGMYNDNRHPNSGGYVWVADCCGSKKEISVFQGSIFECSVYTAPTALKLIYHWCCQSAANNVLQWVKVTSYYLKNFYTLLRSVCVVALHEYCPLMGGSGAYVEIGLVTLGSSIPSTTGPKNVRVEILGVFDASKKIVRMKVINFYENEVSETLDARIKQILQPLLFWIDKNSTILIDQTISKSILEEMGFKKVLQSNSTSVKTLPGPGQPQRLPSNINIMNYLKTVIPKMFQSTLCVLSKILIQQFLDELSWREIWGGNPLTIFNNLLNHLATITELDTGESLISRLNKVSLNPFAESSSRQSILQVNDMLLLSSPTQNSTPVMSENCPKMSKEKNSTSKKLPRRNTTSKSSSAADAATQKLDRNKCGLKRKFAEDFTPFLALEPKNLILQNYYYGNMNGKKTSSTGQYGGNLHCPLCLDAFPTSREIVTHIYQDVTYGAGRRNLKESCMYCLEDLSSKKLLSSHELSVHTMLKEKYCCRICRVSFEDEGKWIIHMWENHDEMEMPYICQVCGYRSSMHIDVIEHFHKEHSNTEHVICPFCTKTFSVATMNGINQVVIHFQGHNSKLGRKCPQCVLFFLTDDDYRDHITVDGAHRSCSSQKCERYILSFFEKPCFMPKPPGVPTDKFILPPPTKKPKLLEEDTPPKGKSILNKNFATPIDTNEKFTVQLFTVNFRCDEKAVCLECSQKMKTEGHFNGHIKCNKCTFATCCRLAMTNHYTCCHPESGTSKLLAGLKLKKMKVLEAPLKCVCGFASVNPYLVAEHLVQCEQTKAYPK